MTHKLSIFHCFLFFILLSFLAVNSPSFAASVDTKNKVAPTISSEYGTSNKKRDLSKNRAYIDYYYGTLKFVQTSDFIEPSPNSPRIPPFKNRTATNSNSNSVFNNSLYKQGKKFIADNKDNDLLQSSLLVFSNTKQFLKGTDLMLHNLTENILLSLKLDSLINSSQFAMWQKMPQTSYNEDKLSTFSYQKQDGSFQLRNIEGGPNGSPEGGSGGGGNMSELIKKILNLENFFYLIGAIIFYLILRMTVKFMLIEKPPT